MRGKQTIGMGRALVSALLLSLLATLLFLTGLTAARTGEDRSRPPGPEPGSGLANGYWLILDPASPPQETLPLLLDILSDLETSQVIIDFDSNLRSTTPRATPGLRVVAAAETMMTLRRLPGVLAVATELPPPPPEVEGLTALGASGTITGRVFEATTQQPLANQADIRVYDAVSFALIKKETVSTDSQGEYAVTVTAPYSQAKVYAEIPGYLPEWYNEKPFFSEADSINLTGGTERNKNFTLDRAGTIAGVLTLEGNGPANGVNVWVYEAEGDPLLPILTGETTDSAGRFSYRTLQSGAYKLRFRSAGIQEEWYEDKSFQADAEAVTVTAGMTTTINAQVTRAGAITGLLTDASTSGPAGVIDVHAIDEDGKLFTGGPAGNNGQYTIGGLPTGIYKVAFSARPAPFGPPYYAVQYYANKPTLTQATPISVTAGKTITNINAVLERTSVGTITGRITKNGGPLPNGEKAQIRLYNAAIDELSYSLGAVLIGDGAATVYTAAGIKGGRYRVELKILDDSGASLGNEYFNDKPDLNGADLVTVTGGAITPNIDGDIDVEAAGCVSGRLTGNGQIIRGSVRVQAYRPDNAGFAGRDTLIGLAEAGFYEICDLPVGDYLISFGQFPSATTWYDGQTSRAAADPVTVTAGATTSDIDGSLDDLGGCIAGQILDGGGRGISDADFHLYETGGDEDYQIYFWRGLFGTDYTREGRADEDGGYVACGLAAGTYVVKAAGDLEGQSEPVTLETGQTRAGVDVETSGGKPTIFLPIIKK